MASEFDPDKVDIILTGCESYFEVWVHGQPMPEGWGDDPAKVRAMGWISPSDYDALYALYRESKRELKILRECEIHRKELIQSSL